MFRLPALFAASAAVASAATSGTSGDLLSASWRSSEEAEFVVVAHESLADWKRQEESDGGGILLAGMKRDGIGEGSSNDDGHALFRSMLDSLERVPVTYLNGQRSVCFLPPPPEAVAAASKKAAARAAQEQAAAAAASGAAETDADKAAAVAARLRRFEGKCATMPDGYWHYAVCPFDKVRQFHPNPKGKPTSEFNLGTFNSTESMEVPSFLARRGGDFSAYTQKFSGGTDGRETQVRACVWRGGNMHVIGVECGGIFEILNFLCVRGGTIGGDWPRVLRCWVLLLTALLLACLLALFFACLPACCC